jgi:ribosomal protein S18 acetylase RimI-like enzyme
MIEIRKAKLKDIDNISNLFLEAYVTQADIVKKHCPQHLEDMILKMDDNIFKDFIKKKIYSKNSVLYVSEEGKNLFGFILFSIVKNSPVYKHEKFGRIDNIYIKNEYQGKGISNQLKDVAFNWFKKKGVKRFQLFVFQNNIHAIKVYEKWGFTNRLIEMRMSI